jgi:hypothetical protein
LHAYWIDQKFIVTKHVGDNNRDAVTVTVLSGANQPPVANAGPDQSVLDYNNNGSAPVTLDVTAAVHRPLNPNS